jgi:hypothetical protein
VIALLAATGCVDRRFIIESNVPNAQVYIDHNPIGPAPAYAPFEYYAVYTIMIVHPGYETITERVHVTAPWYGYPPIDFLTEVLWPFHIRDNRRYFFELHELVRPRVDELINNAESLRQRGYALPEPEHPAPPKLPPGPPPVPPQPVPVVPTVGPQPGVPPGGPPAVPSLPPTVPQRGVGVPPAGSPIDPLLPPMGNSAPVAPLVPSVGPG